MPSPEEIAAARDRLAAAMAAGNRKPPPAAPVVEPAEPDDAEPEGSRTFAAALRGEAEKREDLATVFGAEPAIAEARGEEAAALLEEQRQRTPVTFGGERAPSFLGRLAAVGREAASNAAEGAGTLAAIGSSLLPQSRDTEAQRLEREAAAAQAVRATAGSVDAISRRLLEHVSRGDITEAEAAHLRDLALQADAGRRVSVGLDVEQLGGHGAGLGFVPSTTISAAQQQVIDKFPEFGRILDAYNRTQTAQAEARAQREGATAIESPASYALRLLAAPPSAVVGVARTAAGKLGLAEETPLAEAVPEAIRGGEGFTGGGIEAGRAAGEAVGSRLEAAGLPGGDLARRVGAVGGGLVGFAADLATPVDFGTDLLRAGKPAAEIAEAAAEIPRELRPGMAERALYSALGWDAPAAQQRSVAEIRNRVGGIPEEHAVVARRLAAETGAPIRDASLYAMARGLADVIVPRGIQETEGGLVDVTSRGEALITGIAKALGGETRLVDAAGLAEGRAARARALAARAATTERAGAAARTAAEDLAELRALEADDLDLAVTLRERGLVAEAERVEARVAASQRVQRAEDAARFKAANLEKYKARRAEVAAERAAEAERLAAEAAKARSRADTFQHYARVADSLLAEPPTEATGARLEALVDEVRALAAPDVQIAPGDAARALGGAYMQARTWEVVADVVSRSRDPGLAAVRAEVELGPERFLEAVRQKSAELAETIVKASDLGDTSALGSLLSDRAQVARRLLEYELAAQHADLPTRQAWAWLQRTVGYGTPLIDEFGRPMVAGAAAAGAREAVAWTAGALRSGMLSGFIVPNPKFFVNNMLTAPAIVYSTLGARMAAASVLSFDGLRVLRAMRPGGVLDSASAVARRAGIAAGDGAEIIVRSPTGETWTAEQIARLVAEQGISRSQAAEELGARGIEQLIEFGQRASDGRLKSHLKSLAGYGDNLWAELANASDTLFRVNVLTHALREGRPVEEAVTLARESLFDYGNLSAFERDYLGKVVWFWSFRRNNYRTLFRNILSNPARLRSLAAYNNTMSEATPNGEDTSYLATQGYAENSPQWRMVTDKEAGLRYALNGPAIPQVQAIEDMTDAVTLLALMGEDVQRGAELDGTVGALKGAFRATTGRGFEALVGNIDPVRAAGFSVLFGINVQQGPDAKLTGTLDPRFVWYLQQIPGGWQTAVSAFDLREVPADRVKSGGNVVPGMVGEEGTGQWEIGSDDGRRMWAAFMFALASSGNQRALREYAPIFAAMKQAAGATDDVISPNMGNAPGMTPWDQLGVMSGVLTPVNQPAFENTVERNANVREREVIP